MSDFPNISKVVDNCNQLDAFKKALPENQQDAT
jgi:maleylacetoacetate isomerase/maleylpyruvate isomerase